MEKIMNKENAKIGVVAALILLLLPKEVLVKAFLSMGIMAIVVGVVYAIVFFKRLYSIKERYERMAKKAEREYNKLKSAQKEYEDFSDIFSELEAEKCDADLHFALGIFELSSTDEITKEYLKKKYRELVKIAHPDAGGCELFAQKINDAYALLSSLA